MIIPAGAAAQGEVVATKESGALLKRGKVTVEIASLTVAGETIPLATSLEQKARGGKNDDFWKTVLAPHLLLFARGNSAKLKAGELLSAELESGICFGPGGDGYRPVPCRADPVTPEPTPDEA